MSVLHKGEVFYTSEELDARLRSYVEQTSSNLIAGLKKQKKKEAVAL